MLELLGFLLPLPVSLGLLGWSIRLLLSGDKRNSILVLVAGLACAGLFAKLALLLLSIQY
ncbi:MAG: hypothetical protein EOO63_16275 [Hymenobacter sp.]|nr:MAG: hypothetical protein EOO63_16275 [Hymenobacter sp.]